MNEKTSFLKPGEDLIILTKKNKNFLNATLAVVIIFSLLVIGFTLWFIFDGFSTINRCENFVSPEECNKPVGSFALETGVTSSSIVTGCNVDDVIGNCIYPASSLVEASNICNLFADKCNSFKYDGENVTFLELSGKVNSENETIFVRQNGITFRDKPEETPSSSGNLFSSTFLRNIAPSSGLTETNVKPVSINY